MAEGTCAYPGCDKNGPLKRTWCNAHYLRWWKHGGPVDPPPGRYRQGKPPNLSGCSMDGCERKHYAKGLCQMHWLRLHRHGDPTVVLMTGGWKGDEVGYTAVHERLRRSRGSASTFACLHCGGKAADWAYDGACPNERVGEHDGSILRYSTNPNRYMPLCKKCHAEFDENYPHMRRGSHNVEAATI